MTAKKDQFDAAARDSQGIFVEAMKQIPEGTVLLTTGSGLLRLLDAIVGSDESKWKSCEHIKSPAVTFMHGAFKGQANCQSCWTKLIDAGGAEEYEANPICDLCGAPCPDDNFHEIQASVGPLVILGQVCPACIPVVSS